MAFRANGHVPLADVCTQVTRPFANEVVLSTGVVDNIVSAVLQPGDYLIWGTVDYHIKAVVVDQFLVGLSTDATSIIGQEGDATIGPDGCATLAPIDATNFEMDLLTCHVGPTIVTITAPNTTIYLNGSAVFSGGSVAIYGTKLHLQTNLP